LTRPKRLPAQAEDGRRRWQAEKSTAVLRRGEYEPDEFVVVRSFDRFSPERRYDFWARVAV